MLNQFRQDIVGVGSSVIEKAGQTLFFFLFFLYFWLRVKVCFMFHGTCTSVRFPSFFTTWEFFQSFLEYPGGLTDYVSAFLSQFFYYSLAGAIVVTAQAWALCVVINAIVVSFKLTWLRFISFAPAMIMLLLYNQYAYCFDIILGLLVALLFVCIYIKLSSVYSKHKFVIFLVMSILLYTVAGGGLLVFALLCIMYEKQMVNRGRFIALTIAVPVIIGFYIFGIPIDSSFLDSTPFDPFLKYFSTTRWELTSISVLLLYVLVPAVIAIVHLFKFCFAGGNISGVSAGRKRKKKGDEDKSHTRAVNIFVKRMAGLAVLIAFGAVSAVTTENVKAKTVFAVDYYAYHKDWPAVLKAAEGYPNSFNVIHAVNRALFHTGRLADEMFNYPQHIDGLFLDITKLGLWSKTDFLIDVGMICEAERTLSESLVIRPGENPDVLKRLALVKMVKGDIPAARIYLGALSKTMFHDDWANEYLLKLEEDSGLSSDEYIQYLRSIKVNRDIGTTFLCHSKSLADMLKDKPHNKTAFEYYMVQLMLMRKWDEFAQNIYRLRDLGYLEMPKHYQEAMVAHSSGTKKKVNYYGYKLDGDVTARFRDFGRILGMHSNNKNAAYKDLAAKYGGSYYFYAMYLSSGMKK